MVSKVKPNPSGSWGERKAYADKHSPMSTPFLVMDEVKEAAASRLAQKFLDRNKGADLRSIYLWNVAGGQWNGPWNLAFPGELQRYLGKKDEQGRSIYSLGPSEGGGSPVPVQASGSEPASLDKLAKLEAENTRLKAQLADPQRSGRKRSHRGQRRHSGGG